MEDKTYIVYVQTDSGGNIIALPQSSEFLTPTTGWTQINKGTGDKYRYCQNNYFDKPNKTVMGVYRYKWTGTEIYEKTPEENAVEEAASPPPPPTIEERIAAQEAEALTLSQTLDVLFTQALPTITPAEPSVTPAE